MLRRSKLLGFIFVVCLLSFISPSLAWWNDSWTYRKPITIDNTGNSNDLTNYQVLIVLNSTNFDFSKANSDGSDIRFIDSDDTTKLNYWIEEWDSTNQEAKIWVNVTSIPASSTKTIYMYYGNSDATSESNPEATMSFFDDFSTDPSSRWTVFRYSDDTSNEFYWDSSTEVVYLTKAVDSKGTMAFMNYKGVLDTGFHIRFKFKAGGGDGADGFAFAFYKDKSPYETYGKCNGGGNLGLDAYDGTNTYQAKGYDVEFDNHDNGDADPSDNHIAITETFSSGSVYDNTHYGTYNTGATEDNAWHDVEIYFDKASNHIVVYLDGSKIIDFSGSPFSDYGYPYDGFGFGAGTGGLNNNHVIDNVILRKYTDPEPTASVGEEEAFYKKDITDSVTTSFSIERLRQVLRETTDEYFVTTVLSRQQSLVRCYGDVLSLYEYLEKQQTLAREYTDIIDMIEKLEKTGLLERKADITMDITDKVLRNIFSDREMYLKIETSAVLTREQALERGTVVTYTVDTEVFRKQNLNRITLIKLTLTPDILRYASISRDGKILLLIDTYLYKKLSGTRELIQSIDVYLDTLRRAGISKINLLTLEITPELAKILSQNRYTEITLIVTPEVYKQLVRTRSVADAFSLDFVLEKLGEFVRFLRLDSLFSSGIERQGAFGRNILAEFTLSSGILSRYIPVVCISMPAMLTVPAAPPVSEYAGDTLNVFMNVEFPAITSTR